MVQARAVAARRFKKIVARAEREWVKMRKRERGMHHRWTSEAQIAIAFDTGRECWRGVEQLVAALDATTARTMLSAIEDAVALPSDFMRPTDADRSTLSSDA